jgi:hypothetical protein
MIIKTTYFCYKAVSTSFEWRLNEKMELTLNKNIVRKKK